MNKSDWQEDLAFSSQQKRQGFGFSARPIKSLDVRLRIRLVWGVYVVCMALILAKIMYLQIIERGQHELTSYTNHIELKREVAPRGVIYDRRGEIFPRDTTSGMIVGYVSKSTKGNLVFEGLCYASGALIGRSGVEQVFEERLRGRDGGRLVEVDSGGNEVRELGKNLSERGSDIQLSLDSRLQKIMYEAFSGRGGSAVALDMQGKVLGLVSTPSYDPLEITNYLSDTSKQYF
jgi:cell division protein FtsI/penicillin-binding protein 2